MIKKWQESLPLPCSLSVSVCLIARDFLSTYYIFVEEIFTRTCFFDFVANSRKCLFGKIKLRQEHCQNKVK